MLERKRLTVQYDLRYCCYLRRQGTGYNRSFCLCVILADYWKSNEPITLKVEVMIGPTSRKNWLTFAAAPVPDTDSGSLFHFPHYCGIEDFLDLLAFQIQSPADFYEIWRNDWRRQGNESTFWGCGLIRQTGLESRITFGWDFGVGGGLHSLILGLVLSLCLTVHDA